MNVGNILSRSLLLALLFLLVAIGSQLIMAQLANAKPYPRHDHYGETEDERQYPHRRYDDYEDYHKARHYRRDSYIPYVQPTLSELDKTPEGEISLERAHTKRSTYKYATDGYKSHEGRGFYDQPGNQSYGLDGDDKLDW